MEVYMQYQFETCPPSLVGGHL